MKKDRVQKTRHRTGRGKGGPKRMEVIRKPSNVESRWEQKGKEQEKWLKIPREGLGK